MVIRRLLCLVSLFGYISAAPAAGPARMSSPVSLTVCQLFEHLRRYDGKLITITGPMIRRPDYTLGRVDCGHPFVTDGFTWPSMVALDTTAAAEVHGAPAAFSTDQASLRPLDVAMSTLATENEVWVTVTGELRL